jgi:hypothetical protein
VKAWVRVPLIALQLALAAGLAGLAFYVSFAAITDLMVHLGMPHGRAVWVSPLVETFILVGSIEVILRTYEQEPGAWYPRLLVVGACVVAVGLNAADMYVRAAEPLAWAVNALAPVCQLCALDLILARVRRMAAKQGAPRPASEWLGTLRTAVSILRGEPAPASALGDNGHGHAAITVRPPVPPKALPKGNGTSVAARVAALVASRAEIRPAELARELGTTAKYVSKLKAEETAKANGNGRA